MIDDPEPKNWRELQYLVHRLLSEVGLTAEIEKKIKTPRGEVEIDVWAVDENSVDQICYVVECKNWAVSIPQSAVHSFTTVMHETGGNIGFIVTKSGLQAGAKDYLQNTNIIGLTYLELQHRYFKLWLEKWFKKKVFFLQPLYSSIPNRLTVNVKDFLKSFLKLSKKNSGGCLNNVLNFLWLSVI